jgi:hypothetical protein
LYKLHDGLKIKLMIVINHLLTPVESEAAWNALVDENRIREDETIDGLWNSRKLWVVAYLKHLYCGRISILHGQDHHWDPTLILILAPETPTWGSMQGSYIS